MRIAARGDPRRADDLSAPGLVHELRQPLAGLDAGLRLVCRDLGGSVTELDGWKIAIGQLARLRETLETFDQLMSPDRAGDAPFAVDAVVRRALDAVRYRTGGDRERVALAVEPGVPAAHGSAAALFHALTNLLGNALDAVAQAGGGGRIEVRVLPSPEDPARPQVRVADEGVGIPPAHVPRLFTPRFTTKARGEGSGLGLAIARRMLRRSGGELRLVPPQDGARRPWSRTEFAVELAAGPDRPAPRVPEPRAARWLDRRRRAALAAVVGVALLGAIAIGAPPFLRPRASSEDLTDAVAVGAPAAEVIGIDGTLERLVGGAWQPLAGGSRLLADDTLRTGAGSGATLAIGGGTRVDLSDATQLTVREITAAVQRLRLARGRISVDHRPDGARMLVVEGERAGSSVRAETARFGVLASGTALAVATRSGVVRLQSAGRAVDVGPGEQSVSFRGSAPASARPVSQALLLRVAGALAKRTGGACVVHGSADPGAEVTVDGRAVEPGADGRFTVELPARKGASAAVVTRDAAGRVATRRVACEVEQDVSDFAVEWGKDAR